MDTSDLPFGKGRPAVLEQHDKETAHDRKLAKAYRAVEDREDNRCQVTGVPLFAFASDHRRRREHHHLKGRNVRPEWVYKPERILLVSKHVHDLLTANALVPDGCNARKRIRFFWNDRIVRPGEEPLRLPRRVAA